MGEEQFRPECDRRDDLAVQAVATELRRRSRSAVPPVVKRPTQAMGCRRDADNKRLCKAFRNGWRGHLVGIRVCRVSRGPPVALSGDLCC